MKAKVINLDDYREKNFILSNTIVLESEDIEESIFSGIDEFETMIESEFYDSTEFFLNDQCEKDIEFISNDDFIGLINYKKDLLQDSPTNLNLQYSLGEAYMLNKQYDDALKIFKEIYINNPNDSVAYSAISDIMYLNNLKMEDLEWISDSIFNKSEVIADFCYDKLARKRKPYPLQFLYDLLKIEGYSSISLIDLNEILNNDGRFDICNVDSKISLIKRKKDFKKELEIR